MTKFYILDKDIKKILDTNINEYGKIINPIISDKESVTFETNIDGNVLATIAGIDLAKGKDITITAEYEGKEQKRRHKKKRINKKWAKRYGYKIHKKIFSGEITEQNDLINDDIREFQFITI